MSSNWMLKGTKLTMNHSVGINVVNDKIGILASNTKLDNVGEVFTYFTGNDLRILITGDIYFSVIFLSQMHNTGVVAQLF